MMMTMRISCGGRTTIPDSPLSRVVVIKTESFMRGADIRRTNRGLSQIGAEHQHHHQPDRIKTKKDGGAYGAISVIVKHAIYRPNSSSKIRGKTEIL